MMTAWRVAGSLYGRGGVLADDDVRSSARLKGIPNRAERVLTFKSTQAPSHTTVYANVLSGYIGPRGDLILDFGFDAVPPPLKEVVHVNDAGEVTGDASPDRPTAVDIDREYRVRIVMPGEHAASLARWFSQRADETAGPRQEVPGAIGD